MSQRNTYFQDEIVKDEKIDVKNLKRLMRYVVPFKKMFFFTLVILIVSIASSVVTPLFLRYIVNSVIVLLWVKCGI